jgi:hypothetical protein
MVQEAERRYGDMVLNVNLFVNTQDYMVGYKMQPFFFFMVDMKFQKLF